MSKGFAHRAPLTGWQKGVLSLLNLLVDDNPFSYLLRPSLLYAPSFGYSGFFDRVQKARLADARTEHLSHSECNRFSDSHF